MGGELALEISNAPSYEEVLIFSRQPNALSQHRIVFMTEIKWFRRQWFSTIQTKEILMKAAVTSDNPTGTL